jgi:hypothetical protein
VSILDLNASWESGRRHGRGNTFLSFLLLTRGFVGLRDDPSCSVLGYTYLLPTYHACYTSLSLAINTAHHERVSLPSTDTSTMLDFPPLSR